MLYHLNRICGVLSGHHCLLGFHFLQHLREGLAGTWFHSDVIFLQLWLVSCSRGWGSALLFCCWQTFQSTYSGFQDFFPFLELTYFHCGMKHSLCLSLESWKKHPAHNPCGYTGTGPLQGLPNLLKGFVHGIRCATDIGPLPGWGLRGQEAHHQVPHTGIRPSIKALLKDPGGSSISITPILLMSPLVLQPGRAWQVHSRFRQTEENVRSRGCLMCIFSWAGEPHTLQAVCVQWEAPIPLSTRGKQGHQKAKIFYDIVCFCTHKPTSCYGNCLLDSVTRLWEHYLSGPFKVMGNCFP